MATPRPRTYLYGFAFVCILLAPGIDRPAVAQIQDTPPSSRIPQHAPLIEKTRQAGRLPVIVQLSEASIQAMMDLSQGGSTNERASGIAAVQDLVLSRLGMNQAGKKQRRYRAYRHIPFMAMEVDEGLLLQLLAHVHVEQVIEDRIFEPMLLESTQAIGARAAWEYGGTGAGQAIAVIDTGVDQDHPFLEGKVVREACFSTSYTSANGGFESISMCPDSAEEAFGRRVAVHCDISIAGCDHGTRVAGIVAGKGEDFSGVARDADLVAIQVFSHFESYCGPDPCARSWVSDQIAALEYVYALRDSLNVAAVNLSLGGGHYRTEEQCNSVNPAMFAVFDILAEANIPVIAAAGNSGLVDGLVAPACLSNAISVGATTKFDAISSFSSSAKFLDLLAPGEDIVTSVPGGAFRAGTGTSFSTPHVAGAWAILRSKSPDASIEELKGAFQETGVYLMDARNDVETARIQVDQALQAATLPVELVRFDALVDNATVELIWETASETNNAGFEVQHSLGGPYRTVEFIPGGGTRTTLSRYGYRVDDLAPGVHAFRLKQRDFDGTASFSPAVEALVKLKGAYHMGAAYPNPFNPATQFTLTIDREQHVRIEVYDILGRRVATLVNERLEPGQLNVFTLDGAALSSGIFLIQATGEYFQVARTVTLLK